MKSSENDTFVLPQGGLLLSKAMAGLFPGLYAEWVRHEGSHKILKPLSGDWPLKEHAPDRAFDHPDDFIREDMEILRASVEGGSIKRADAGKIASSIREQRYQQGRDAVASYRRALELNMYILLIESVDWKECCLVGKRVTDGSVSEIREIIPNDLMDGYLRPDLQRDALRGARGVYNDFIAVRITRRDEQPQSPSGRKSRKRASLDSLIKHYPLNKNGHWVKVERWDVILGTVNKDLTDAGIPPLESHRHLQNWIKPYLPPKV
ncbi:hypothetical protein [Hwanghaeella sp.]|uniref:hypothetical protein n=1 Tax=Hwanghaeella sp. TaxID=2605943 RepID=UPI003CCC0A0A